MKSPFVPIVTSPEKAAQQGTATRLEELVHAAHLPSDSRGWESAQPVDQPTAVTSMLEAHERGRDHRPPSSTEAAQSDLAPPTVPALDAILQQMVTRVATVVASDTASIILFEQTQGRIAYTRGFAPAATAFFQTHRFALNELVPLGVVANARPYLVPDTRCWPDWIPLAATAWIRSSLGVPIAIREQTIGLLVLDSATSHAFQPTDLDKVQAFVQGVNLALANAQDIYLWEKQVAVREAELHASKAQAELLQLLIDAMPDPIYIKDRQHRFVLHNQNPDHSRQGMHPQQTIGKTDFAFYPPALAEAFQQEEAAIFRTGQPLLRHEMPLPCEDGSEIWVAVTKVPLRDLQGAIIGLAGFSCDITERKRKEEALRTSEARYRLLADNITDIVCRLNPSLECLYVSPASIPILGYTPAELIGQSGFPLIHPADLPMAQQALQQALTQHAAPAAVRMRLRHKQGHYVWLDLSGRALFVGESRDLLEFVVSARDVTKQKQAEDAVQEALQKAHELNELKSRFVSMASHEFRTPLTSILLMTETLRAYRHKLTTEQIDQRLTTICKQVEHLKTIIEDVLELTCIQDRRVELDALPVDLDALCRTIVDELQPLSELTPRLLYHCATGLPPVKLDQRLMRQVITNLLTNAIKYSPNGAPIWVRLAYTGAAVLLQVEDSGIGIPAFDLPYLFQPFHRASNVGAIAGTGLGLIITKEAVELHGGTISVTSQENVGTTFTVLIPSKTTVG